MKSLRIALLIASTTFVDFAHGNEANRLFYDGVRAEAGGDLDTAIVFYEKAAVLAHSANLHGNLANLQFKMGNHGKAVLHFRKALLLDPRNSELRANLAFAREKAGLPSSIPTVDDSYFAPESLDVWICSASILFWTGLLAGVFLYRSYSTVLTKIFGVSGWVGLVVFSVYAAWRAEHNAKLLTREAVAVTPQVFADANETAKIPLRRYAGEADANANLQPGELVRIATDENGGLKRHVTPDGVTWYLAHSVSGSSKGWATNKELLLILN